jgi:hypothetical protein
VIDGPPCIAFHPANVRLASLESITENGFSIKGKLEGMIDIGARVRFIIALGPGDLIEIEKDVASLSGNCLPNETEISMCIPSNSIIEFKEEGG